MDGNDTALKTNRAVSPTTYYAKLVYKHVRENSTATTPTLFRDVKNGVGCYMYMTANSSSIIMRVVDGVNARSRNTFMLTVGETYIFEWVVRSFAVGSIDCDLIINGDVVTPLINGSVTTSDGRYLWSSATPGTGKISYLKTVFNGVPDPLYAPAVYGVPGTADCGNGWILTDGSPATFWVNYGQDFGLLVKAGGTFEGADLVIRPARPVSPTTYESTMVYRHDRTNPSDNVYTLYKDVKNGVGVQLYVNNLANTAVMRVLDGTNLRTRSITLVPGTAYEFRWVVRSFEVGAIDCEFWVNGDMTTGTSSVSTTTDGRYFGSSTLPGLGKISLVRTVVDGVLEPEYNPSTFGVFGTNDAGNGWTLTDGSPTTFWS